MNGKSSSVNRVGSKIMKSEDEAVVEKICKVCVSGRYCGYVLDD